MSLAASYSISAIFSAKDKLSPALDKISKNYKSFGGLAGRSLSKLNTVSTQVLKTMAVGFTAIAGAATVAGSAIYKLVSNTASIGDEIAKTSRLIGISVESLQELRFAADRQGVSAEMLTTSLQKLNVNVADLQSGQGSLYTALKKTNPSLLTSLKNVKSNEQAFEILVNAISKTPSQLQKASLAQDAFGRSGIDMLKLIEAGSSGISDLRLEAIKLGIIMSTDAANAAEAFNDAETNLKATLTGLKYNIASGLMPAMTKLTTKFVDLYVKNKDLINLKINNFIQRISDKITNAIDSAGGFDVILNKAFLTIEKFGKGLFNVINFISGINNQIQKLGGWFNLIKILLIATVAIKGFAIAWLFVNKVLLAINFIKTAGSIAKAMTLLNLAFLMSPITWIILGIVAAAALLTFGIIKLVQNWDKVKIALKNSFEWIKKNKEMFISLLGPIGVVINIITSLISRFGEIKQAFSGEGIIAGFLKIGEIIWDALVKPIEQFIELLKNINPFSKEAQIKREEKKQERLQAQEQKDVQRSELSTNGQQMQSKQTQMLYGNLDVTVTAENGAQAKVDKTYNSPGWDMSVLGLDGVKK